MPLSTSMGEADVSLLMHITSSVCAVAGFELHAAQALRSPKVKRKTWDAACGKRVKLLVFPIHNHPDTAMTVVWPPYVADAREWGYERCRECLIASPGKPQRPAFAPPTHSDDPLRDPDPQTDAKRGSSPP
jgi:hypothetical protein